MTYPNANPGALAGGTGANTKAGQLQSKEYIATPIEATLKPTFATGYGQSDTHARTLSDGRPNPHKSAGLPYATVCGADVFKMAKEPSSVPKDQAQWFIPSTYTDHDARKHVVQCDEGAFRWLTVDVDKNNLALADVDIAVSAVIGDECRLIYSTRSATAENRKWRALVPLATTITGADFSDTQIAFFDLLEQASGGVLIPDRALSRPAQLVYLPNKGEFYQYALVKGAKPC
jgi:hypothetical protein